MPAMEKLEEETWFSFNHFRSDLIVGDITREDVFAVFPFNNTVDKVTMKGRNLLIWGLLQRLIIHVNISSSVFFLLLLIYYQKHCRNLSSKPRISNILKQFIRKPVQWIIQPSTNISTNRKIAHSLKFQSCFVICWNISCRRSKKLSRWLSGGVL